MISSKLKSRLEHIFYSTGREGKDTKLWINLDKSIQKVVQSSFQLLQGEYLVLVHYNMSGNFFAVTNARLVKCIESKVSFVDINDLTEVNPVFDKSKPIRDQKLTNPFLNLVTSDGSSHLLKLEPGMPLNGVHNLLLSLLTLRDSKIQ